MWWRLIFVAVIWNLFSCHPYGAWNFERCYKTFGKFAHPACKRFFTWMNTKLHIKMVSKYFLNVADFKYLATAVVNQKFFHEGIKSV